MTVVVIARVALGARVGEQLVAGPHRLAVTSSIVRAVGSRHLIDSVLCLRPNDMNTFRAVTAPPAETDKRATAAIDLSCCRADALADDLRRSDCVSPANADRVSLPIRDILVREDWRSPSIRQPLRTGAGGVDSVSAELPPLAQHGCGAPWANGRVADAECGASQPPKCHS